MTPKQEAFARAYVETGNASEAYRRSYSADNMGQASLEVEAHRVLTHPKVSLRVSQLQAKHQKRHEITVDTITEMLKEDRELARKNAQTGAAVSASMGLAKLHGLIVDKKEITHKESIEDLTDDELANLARSGGNGVVTASPSSSRSH